MADIEWKPLPTGLWTPTAVFAEVENLLLQTFTEDGVPTWEISKKREGNGANGTSSPRAVPTPSRQPKRRRSSKPKQHRGDHKGA